ncbi:MAG: DUF3488 domain-containing transglutaminase family protein [Gammaproteobacteria bacterium]|nr:DUF3488 domain-containing transglutaminase family protein [Gammaproteobacteria bacterium]
MTARPTAADYLTQASLLRLLAVLALVVAPHLPRLPPWAALLVVVVLLWRAAAAVRLWPLPPQALKLAVATVAFAGIYAHFGRGSGQTAGTALLTVMIALKLTEMRARRDVMVVISLCYFLLLTHFLFSQEIWTVAYLLVCAVAITALLIESNHPGAALAPGITLRQGARMVAQALPLMAVLFVLFPRLPGPLWGLPSDAGAARSGLSDSMSPGDIAQLIQSDAVAFRVRFDDAPPPMAQRYWRGPVFWNFDGRRWGFSAQALAGGAHLGPVAAEFAGAPTRYELTLEPHRQRWLFALDLADPQALPAGATLTYDHQLFAARNVTDRLLYRAASYTQYRLQPELPERPRRIALTLPAQGSPRARALARSWREDGLADADVVGRALRMFREQSFYYTLKPPALGREAVDEFLFDTRRGFCEHYASSFTVLMRAAGIPARVVTGYQGGERNELGGYYVVRQSDAHAWSEVWLDGRGWVRVDPTAAVAPTRIEAGLGAALSAAEGLPGFLQARGSGSWRYALEARWDLVNARWNEWVLAYGPALQQEFLSRFGLADWQRMIAALTGAIMLILAALGAAMLRQSRPVRTHDRALRLWRRAARRLARQGWVQRASEGPQDFAERVARARPELGPAVRRLAQAYLRARYLEGSDPANEARLAEAARGRGRGAGRAWS